MAGITSLELPVGTYVEHLAISDSEWTYVRGYIDTEDARKEPRMGFAALLDPAGQLARDLSSDVPKVDLTAYTGPVDGDAIAGEDGRFYVLDPSKVLVLSQAGEVQSELKFQKPASDAHAVRMDYSRGVISIIFHSIHPHTPNKLGEVNVRALLLNAQTGEPQGDYIFDSTTTGSVDCFNLRDGYSLSAVDGKMSAMDSVPIR